HGRRCPWPRGRSPPSPTPVTHSPPRSVLVVEDDPHARDALSHLLGGEGYAVRTAANGRDALTLLSAGPLPDLILLALMLPVLSGWGFRRLQLADPALAGIPVIVLSALADDAAREGALGDVTFLQKPVAADALVIAIRKPVVLVVDDEEAIRAV